MFTTPFTHLRAFLLHPVGSGVLPISPEFTPTLQPFEVPRDVKATGAAMIVCPGGGYQGNASHEGLDTARFLARHGIAAFVLRYRCNPSHPHPEPLSDAQRALRFVRCHAGPWGLDEKRIGIAGFSAGGHLASSAATHYDDGNPDSADPIDRQPCRPDAQVLIYSVISMGSIGHEGTRRNLLGENPDPALVASLSNETQVNAQTPPAFIMHSTLDKGVDIANSDLYVAALKTHGIKHRYLRGEFGVHGIGLHESWSGPCLGFLREIGF